MKLKNILSFLLVAVIFTILVRNIIQNWSLISSFPWRFNTTDLILLFLFLIPIYLINGGSWFLVVRAFGTKIDYLQSVRIWSLSNASRFIPGVVWQYIGRVYLSSRAGVSGPIALSALLVEFLFVMTIGLIIVLATFTFWRYPADTGFFKIAVLILPILLALIFLFSNQKLVRKIASIHKRITNKKGAVKSFRLSPLWIVVLAISYSMQFIFDGSVLFFLTRQAINLDWTLYPIFIGIFAGSWLLGYITMIAPAGLGVQEISIATMLSFYMPFPVASMIAILFRLALLLTEALTILFVTIFFKRSL